MKKRGIIAAACVLALAFGATAASPDAVQVRSKEGIGKYLADGKGMTLYYFLNDKGAKGAGCMGPCLVNWPVFYREKIAASAGLEDADFGVITRADGAKQSTFRGWPMYYFTGDKAPGDANGQGLMNAWFAITPMKIQPYP